MRELCEFPPMQDHFPHADEVLDLSGQATASGSLQQVYPFPGRDDLLIKVVHPNFAAERRTGWRGADKRLRRLGVLTGASRVITEHLALRNAGVKPGRHVQEFVGVVETTEGVGVVVRAVRGRDGAYAPTLKSLIKEGRFDPGIEALLDEFEAWLLATPIIVGDLHMGNVVLGWDERHGERLVLIDGMGEKNFVPLNSWFPALNRANTRDRIHRMRRIIDAKRAAAQR
jgi:hypothetical protein